MGWGGCMRVWKDRGMGLEREGVMPRHSFTLRALHSLLISAYPTRRGCSSSFRISRGTRVLIAPEQLSTLHSTLLYTPHAPCTATLHRPPPPPPAAPPPRGGARGGAGPPPPGPRGGGGGGGWGRCGRATSRRRRPPRRSRASSGAAGGGSGARGVGGGLRGGGWGVRAGGVGCGGCGVGGPRREGR